MGMFSILSRSRSSNYGNVQPEAVEPLTSERKKNRQGLQLFFSPSPLSPDGEESQDQIKTRATNKHSGKVSYGGKPQPLPIPFSAPRAASQNAPEKASLPRIRSEGEIDKDTDFNTLKKPDNSFSSSPHSDSSTSEEFSPISMSLIPFSLRELQKATGNFSSTRFLGEGGFGAVHMGIISEPKSGRSLRVAVKALHHGGLQGEKEWLAEVTYLGKVHHPNLIKLVGYCSERGQKILVYKYAVNGSLEKALFHSKNSLSWLQRIKIAIEAAQGLNHLHDLEIIYRDFKTSNILLDKNYEVKLSDFGLARNAPDNDKSHVTTRVVGTVGYAAPEYLTKGHLSVKSDVWGFGVVLLELLTGRVAIDMKRPAGEQSLVEWAEPMLKQQTKLFKVMDPNLAGEYSVKAAKQIANIALRCLDLKPKLRPRMVEVLAVLKPLLELQETACSGTMAGGRVKLDFPRSQSSKV